MTQTATGRRWLTYSKASGILKSMIIDGSHDPAVLDKAAELVKGLGQLNYPAQAQALWLYVRNTIFYLSDPYHEDHFQTPAVTMQRGAGDCDDQVILLGSLLRSVGFQVRLVFVFHQPPKNYEADFPDHVLLEVNLDSDNAEQSPMWVAAETIPTPDDCGGFYLARFGAQRGQGFREYLDVS
jgi:transglutaminase-like putative cysteine protease